MAEKVNLYTVDHYLPPCNPDGGIATNFSVSKKDCLLGNRTFADMVAQSQIWRRGPLDDDIVGFQGYRKHLDFRFFREVKGYCVSLDPIEFRQYQIWQQDCAGPNIEHMLTECDVLTNPYFSVADKGGIQQDFKASASATDWDEMERVMKQHGDFDFNIPSGPSYGLSTCNGRVFNEWMNFWWPVVCELMATLPAKCPDPGLRPDIYRPRRMAFLSGCIYAIWLAASGLRTKQLPLLVCWELQS